MTSSAAPAKPPGWSGGFTAVNPANGELVSSKPYLSESEFGEALASAERAQKLWRRRPVSERARLLNALAREFRAERQTLAELMAVEMGKPLTQGLGEIEKCADCCEYFAQGAAEFLEPVSVSTSARGSYWSLQPLGLVLGIMPWNFPFWQVVRFAVPTLALGNGVLLKHAPSVPGCALALERLFRAAGFPEGVYTNLFVDMEATGRLIADGRVRAISLTGSVRAGRAVAAQAGSSLKKCVLELGGSDPALVLADAELDSAVEACAWGRMRNTGQSCIATKRVVAVEEIREDFETRLATYLGGMRVGDPLDPSTEIGPMARADLRDELDRQVRSSIDRGASLLMGGECTPGPGAWYPPTLLTDVQPGMPAYGEELFGPVAVVIPARDEADALRIANDTSYGLGASVFTADLARGEEIAREMLDAGNCFVNRAVESVKSLPFGGVKASGYGRELSSLGMMEFANVKTVYVA